jgi:hypothetical protein
MNASHVCSTESYERSLAQPDRGVQLMLICFCTAAAAAAAAAVQVMARALAGPLHPQQ